MNKKKILFVCGHMKIGGVEKSLLDLVTHIDNSKYDIYLLLVESSSGEYLPNVPDYVRVSTLDSEKIEGPFFKILSQSLKKREWRAIRHRLVQLLSHYFGNKVYSVLRSDIFDHTHFDVSIGFKPDHCSYISTFAVPANLHLTWWHHGDFLLNRRDYIKLSIANDKVICVSQGTKQLLYDIGVAKNHISIIPNMVDVEIIKAKASMFSPNYPQSKFNIVSVGRFAPEKQFDLIPTIVSLLKNNLSCDFIWHIIGDGSMKECIEKEIQMYGVGDYVKMHGNQINPYPYIKNADLFVHPSRTESQGLAVLEAMALGIPTISGITIGTKEYIEDGVNGLIVTPEKDSLYLAIKKIIESKDLYQIIKWNSKLPAKYLPVNVISEFEKIVSNSV